MFKCGKNAFSGFRTICSKRFQSLPIIPRVKEIEPYVPIVQTITKDTMHNFYKRDSYYHYDLTKNMTQYLKNMNKIKVYESNKLIEELYKNSNLSIIKLKDSYKIIC